MTAHIEIKQAVINDKFINDLGDTLGDPIDQMLLIEQLKKEVAQGVEVLKGDQKVGVGIIRQERPDLVICCYKGTHSKEFSHKVCEVAKLNGFMRVRFHTNHVHADRFLRDTHFKKVESIYRVDV